MIFTYNRNDYGLASWSGVQVYVTTWDIDGIGASSGRSRRTAASGATGGGAPPDTARRH